MCDETLVVHCQQRVVRMSFRRNQRGAGGDERVPDDLRPSRNLVSRIRKPDPDLAARLVEQAAIAPHDGHREGHELEPNPCRLARVTAR